MGELWKRSPTFLEGKNMEYRLFISEDNEEGGWRKVEFTEFAECFSYIESLFRKGESFRRAEIYYNVSVGKWLLQTTIIMHWTKNPAFLDNVKSRIFLC